VALTVDDDAVILDSGIRLKFFRDAEYDAAPPLVGIDPSGNQVLLECTPDGKLKTDTSISVASATFNFTGDEADLDSGAGTDEHEVVAIGLPGSGGHVVGGTATNPFRVDPTGTTTQPISASSLPLPTGASTETTLAAIKLQTDKLTFLSDELKVSANLSLTTVGIENASDVRINPATEEKQDTGNTSLASLDLALASIDSKIVTVDTGSVTISTALPAGANTIGVVDQGLGGASAWKVDGSAVTQPISAAALPLPLGASTEAKQDTGNTSLSSIDGKLNSLGQKTMAGSVPVTLASDQTPLSVAVTGNSAGTSALSNVSGSATSVTILAANSGRKMMMIFNEASNPNAVLYLNFGSTASITSYTLQVPAGAYYEMPVPVYTGEINGIWSTSTAATARVTELT
jgi:hypothetical protein